MKKLDSILKSFLILVTLVTGMIPATFATPLSEGRKVSVGVILPLTGEVAAIGYAVKNGIDLAYESLPPTLKDRIVIHFEDDGFQPKNTVTALSRLLSEKKIDVLINAGSSTSNSLAPIAESKKLPFFGIATDPKVSTGKKYVFNFWVSPEAETDLVVPEMVKRGYKSIARLATIHDMNTAIKKSFDTKSAGKISITSDEEYASDAKDFKSFLTRIRADKPDAILALLFPGQIGVFAKQAREMGINAPLVGYEMFEDPGEVKASNGAMIGQWYVNADEPVDSFVTVYKKRFPDAATFGSANGHDAIKLIAAAVEKGVPPDQFSTFLKEIKNFTGALGTYSFTTEAGNNSFTLPAALKIVTEKGFEQMK